jgi:TonB family protein
MMFFSDSQEIVSRFGDSIEEFRRVFRANDVDFGTPDDFFAFSRTLKHDTQLRGGLSALAKSIMAKENEASLRTILTIIAVASGGPEVANSGRDMSRPVNLLIDFLIEAGGCSHINSEYPDSPCSEAAAAAYATDHSLTLNHSFDEEMRAEQPEVARHASEEPDSDAPALQSSPDRFSDTHTLTESLTRLELNSLQVKLYLDSIDQRISRMEPRLENVPALAPSNTTPRPRDDDAKFSAAIPSTNEPRPPQNDPHPPAPPARETSTTPVSSLPLWANSRQLPSSNRHAALSAAFAFAALLLCVLFFWSFARDTTHAEVHPANITGYETTNANPTGSGSPITSVPAATTSTLQPGNPVPEDSHSGAVGNQPYKNSAAITFSPTPKPKPKPYPVPATAAPRQALVADASEAPDDPDTATMRPYKSSSVSQSGSLLNVSSGVMAANLLAAPMPAYPKLASLARMQGNVIMQAIISKDGTVESVHVLKGHRLLRSAATNAVRAWRYQPYLVNGRPVEVATIVSVDFTLQH